MILLNRITECVNAQLLVFLKGCFYWFLLTNKSKCRRELWLSDVQSKSPTLEICSQVLACWALMFISPWFPPKDEMGRRALLCQHYIWWVISPSAKGSPEIQENLYRKSSALSLKRSVWSCELLLSFEKHIRHHFLSPSVAWFQKPSCFSEMQSYSFSRISNRMIWWQECFWNCCPWAFLRKGWALSSSLYHWMKSWEEATVTCSYQHWGQEAYKKMNARAQDGRACICHPFPFSL